MSSLFLAALPHGAAGSQQEGAILVDHAILVLEYREA